MAVSSPTAPRFRPGPALLATLFIGFIAVINTILLPYLASPHKLGMRFPANRVMRPGAVTP
jgi:hypothetical protein